MSKTTNISIKVTKILFSVVIDNSKNVCFNGNKKSPSKNGGVDL